MKQTAFVLTLALFILTGCTHTIPVSTYTETYEEHRDGNRVDITREVQSTTTGSYHGGYGYNTYRRPASYYGGAYRGDYYDYRRPAPRRTDGLDREYEYRTSRGERVNSAVMTSQERQHCNGFLRREYYEPGRCR